MLTLLSHEVICQDEVLDCPVNAPAAGFGEYLPAI